MRQALIALLDKRRKVEIDPRSPLKFLITAPVESYIDMAISIVYLYTRPKKGFKKQATYLTEVISALGHGVRNKLKLKRDSSAAAKTGAFILYSFEQLGLLEVTLGQGSKGHNAYIIQVTNDDLICALWNALTITQAEKLPSLTPFAPWVSTKHETGATLVKTGNKRVLESLQPDTHPIVFSCVNKAQTQGWRVNKDIYDIYRWALDNKTEAFSDIWDQHNPEARTTKLREAKAIITIADKFVDKTFYHLYYYDFRGRKYPTTAYLHEQGSDAARGLLLRADQKALGKDGAKWLYIYLANLWAGDADRADGLKTDKLPLRDRVHWTMSNAAVLLSYATDPKTNQGWMQADKPWQFLAACFEFNRLVEYCSTGRMTNGFESSLECYLDGSNNGSQHLSALTLDEETAPHVNLVPLAFPGDLYNYVAKHVWERIDEYCEDFSLEEKDQIDVFISELLKYKTSIHALPQNSDVRKSLIEDLKVFRNSNKELLTLAAPVFWKKLSSPKDRRKVVKRNVMTLPYGGTPYGLGEQQISDAPKHGIELLNGLEQRWGAYMGREVYESCRVSLKRPMQLLTVFEKAGKAAEDRGEFLSWTVPVTNFPVVQNYTQGKVKKIWVQYGPPEGERLGTGYYTNTLQLAVCFIEDVVPSKNKQGQSASPNAIHSLDAAHLAITVHEAEFSITTIHDSYGALLGDVEGLFILVRETFVELYETNPLEQLMKDIQGDASQIMIGSLDIRAVLESDYCFV